MHRLLLTLLILAGAVCSHAEEYPYLTFETADGTKTSFSTTDLSITIQDGRLYVGLLNFDLADLSKMYFSVSDDTTAISEVNATDLLDGTTDVFDLQGRKVDARQMKRGIYVIRTKNGCCKVNVR